MKVIEEATSPRPSPPEAEGEQKMLRPDPVKILYDDPVYWLGQIDGILGPLQNNGGTVMPTRARRKMEAMMVSRCYAAVHVCAGCGPIFRKCIGGVLKNERRSTDAGGVAGDA